MMKSQREKDHHAEQEIAKFLDANLYSRDEFSDVARVTDREAQLSGIDVEFSWGDLKKIKVDEKAAAHYIKEGSHHINDSLPTFAFEIDSFQRGKLIPGWLFDQEKKTEYYLLVWIWADRRFTKETLDEFFEENITELDCLLIKRPRLIEHLKEHGHAKEWFMNEAKRIRDDKLTGQIDKGKYSFFHFYRTQTLEEKPVNAIIYKWLLHELCIFHEIIKRPI